MSLFFGGLMPQGAAGAPGGSRACMGAYEEQRYEEAVKICRALARNPFTAKEDVVKGLEVLGMAYLVLRRQGDASAAFCRLAGVAPDYVPKDPIYPKRFVTFFETVRKEECPVPLRMHLGDASTRSQVAVRIVLEGELPSVGRLAVYFREAGASAWHRELRELGRELIVELPKATLGWQAVEVFGALLVDEDYAVAWAHSSSAPLRLTRGASLRKEAEPAPGPRRGPSVGRRWIWWSVAGVVVVGAAVSTSVVLTRRQGAVGSLDTVKLPTRVAW